MKFLYGDSDGRDKITAACLDKIDQGLFDQAFPFKEHIPMIDLSNACCRTLKMPPEIFETDMLIVATEHPERDLCLAEKLCGSAQKAFLKLLFTPRQVTVKGFTNQVCYREDFPFSERLGRFLGLAASPEYAREWAYVGRSNKDLLEVCDIPDPLHYRFYSCKGGDLVAFSKECFSTLIKENMKIENSCYVLLFGHGATTVQEYERFFYLFRDGLGDIPHFHSNLFMAEAKYRGISLLIA